jgi:hypothetical protein
MAKLHGSLGIYETCAKARRIKGERRDAVLDSADGNHLDILANAVNLTVKIGLTFEAPKEAGRTCRRVLTALLFFLVATCQSRLWADDGDYDSAVSAAQASIDLCDQILKVDVQEIQRLVTAISEGDDEEIKQIMKEKGDAAIEKLKDGFDKSKEQTDKAFELLDAVIKDPNFQDNDKKDNLRNLRKELETKWGKVQKVGDGPGKVNPLLEWRNSKGEELHASRMSGCTVSGFGFGDGEADCIRTPCDIIEFKPDNSRGKDKATKQLKGARNALLNDSDKRAELNGKNSEFAKCTEFTMTIEAYTLVPEIDEEGNFREVSASWSTYTVSP